mgnify:CR=1 FL=1
MFTGLVESLGKVANIEMATDSAVITFDSVPFAEQLNIGDSVSVNGACLTVTKLGSESFSVDVMTQTLKLTSLQNLQKGDAVNLERAALVSSRLGGHIVQGHIDGTGSIALLAPGEKWLQLDIQFPMLDNDPSAELGIDRPAVLPTTIILDPDGQVSQVLVGPQTLDSLARAAGQAAPADNNQ